MNNYTKKMVAIDKEQSGFLLSMVLADMLEHQEVGVVERTFKNPQHMAKVLKAVGGVSYDHLSKEEQDEKVAGVLRQLIYAFDSSLLTK
ncbi:hypothetical protein ACW5UC_24880 [Priestia aryabhattai]|uniref:hypothetical protein n=1 Tax=Priestia megaterium TaxID=1404 RepID=UPI003F96A5BD